MSEWWKTTQEPFPPMTRESLSKVMKAMADKPFEIRPHTMTVRCEGCDTLMEVLTGQMSCPLCQKEWFK